MTTSSTQAEALRILWPALDERQRRLAAGALAEAIGYGGIGAAARELGLSRKTVAVGLAEVRDGVVPRVGVRAPGGGRPRSSAQSSA